MTYEIAHCQEMIRHYREQSTNWTKPERWRSLALASLAGWQSHLDSLLAGENFWSDED